MLVFTALGMAMSTLIPNVDAAGPAVSVVFFLLVFLSGLYYYIPPEFGVGPVLVVLSGAPPDHWLCSHRSKAATTSPWAWHDLGVMAIWGVVGVVVTFRRWQWAPRRG